MQHFCYEPYIQVSVSCYLQVSYSAKIHLVALWRNSLEYEEVIQRKYSVSTANALVALLKELPNVRFQNTYYKWQLISIDEDDNKYVDCAIAGSANYLVTQDKHFQILKTINFPKVNVISINEFILKLSKPLQKD